MTHPTAKVSEEVNRKLLAKNTMTVQLSTVYTDPDYHNAQCYRQTEGHHDANSWPDCKAVWSAKQYYSLCIKIL